MQSSAPTPATLVPTLTDLFNKRVKHPATALQPGDSLHLTAPILGFPKGRKVAIYGYCVQFDTQGFAYSAVAYVRPDGLNDHAVAYSEREAGRYPTDAQREQWFGSVLMYLTEIDLTDYADCLRLERLSERVTPLLPAAIAIDYRLAA
jgi:hypothetical protein